MQTTSKYERKPVGTFTNIGVLEEVGLSSEILRNGIEYTYHILDVIDNTLIASGSFRLSQMMELANLSTFVGNLLGAGIANASNEIFMRNGPHKYPDLLCTTSSTYNIEIKVALEDNKPKGHLAKPGYYLVCRYILGNELGPLPLGQRGDVVWIWELRFGLLNESDFNKSNTEGDSGKTAVVNRVGMQKLKVVYYDLNSAPFSPKGKVIREYRALYTTNSDVAE